MSERNIVMMDECFWINAPKWCAWQKQQQTNKQKQRKKKRKKEKEKKKEVTEDKRIKSQFQPITAAERSANYWLSAETTGDSLCRNRLRILQLSRQGGTVRTALHVNRCLSRFPSITDRAARYRRNYQRRKTLSHYHTRSHWGICVFHASVAVSEKDASCAREVADRFNETFRRTFSCTGSDSFSSFKQSYVKAGTTETRPELSLLSPPPPSFFSSSLWL